MKNTMKYWYICIDINYVLCWDALYHLLRRNNIFCTQLHGIILRGCDYTDENINLNWIINKKHFFVLLDFYLKIKKILLRENKEILISSIKFDCTVYHLAAGHIWQSFGKEKKHTIQECLGFYVFLFPKFSLMRPSDKRYFPYF